MFSWVDDGLWVCLLGRSYAVVNSKSGIDHLLGRCRIPSGRAGAVLVFGGHATGQGDGEYGDVFHGLGVLFGSDGDLVLARVTVAAVRSEERTGIINPRRL